MLDFYLIKDITTKPNTDTSNLEHVGSINYETFEYLQKIKIIEEWLDFYGDFRWSYEQVFTKYNMIQKINHSYNIQSILSILQKAKDSENGLIAYGD